MIKNDDIIESLEDSEPIGPGEILAQAREKSGLSLQDVADKLNFRLALVKEIEQNKFNSALPATFNRGYLKNYAKLVNASEKEVLDSYQAMSAAKEHDTGMQSSAMQSFSKQTEKQAENNRLMWVSYLILAILLGSSLMWWLQDGKLNIIEINESNPEETIPALDNAKAQNELSNALNTAQNGTNTETLPKESEEQLLDAIDTALEEAKLIEETLSENIADDNSIVAASSENVPRAITTEPTVTPIDVSFTFLGDCWVNIYDASGERIAWGIKKAGYEMNISGNAPFSITLGKPELVTIVYDGTAVDMTQFNRGNIAKFTLPLE